MMKTWIIFLEKVLLVTVRKKTSSDQVKNLWPGIFLSNIDFIVGYFLKNIKP
jgi:hypothetical protein